MVIDSRRKKEEGKRKREEGKFNMRAEGRRKKEEGRRKKRGSFNMRLDVSLAFTQTIPTDMILLGLNLPF
ncbi:MAG: hypothetical protein F6K23_12195 [Okeania sp. SIO2C9]|uniref:hypothetical protein n=1 Tax=Okeania sp. SIO2C9 TaxID=2607791 RepID=UPI0013C1FB63|nr:hypothetical protein [Okeania sp. SIO2C9]NEQ73741.1 hypothetical protein [Okeania sp. SIO2C9]